MAPSGGHGDVYCVSPTTHGLYMFVQALLKREPLKAQGLFWSRGTLPLFGAKPRLAQEETERNFYCLYLNSSPLPTVPLAVLFGAHPVSTASQHHSRFVADHALSITSSSW